MCSVVKLYTPSWLHTPKINSHDDPTCPRVLCLRVRFSAGTTQNSTQEARSDAECYKLCLLIICKNEILTTPPNLKNS